MARHGVEPGRKARRAAEVVEVAVGLDEHVLRHVGGHVTVAHDAEAPPGDTGVVTLEQLIGQVAPLFGGGAGERCEELLVGCGLWPHRFEYSGLVMGVVE